MTRGVVISRTDARSTVAAIHRALEAGYPLEAGSGGGRTRGAYSVAADALNISRGGMATRLRAIRRHHPDLTIDGSRFKARAPASTPEQVDMRRAQAEAAHARSALADAHKEIVRLQDRMHDLEWAANASARPAEWTTNGRRRIGGEHIPYLLTSDFQIGETIRPEEIDLAHGYSTDIFRRRYRKLIDVTIALCLEHTGPSWKYPGIVYARGGDTISGAIHDELAATDDLTPIQACEVAYEEEAAGILKLAEAFGRVDVKDAGGGNHDRSTKKPQSKRANALSYDRLVSFMLRREFRNDHRVHFQATESPDVFFPIYDLHVLLTHGDKIGSRGGQGFIGPVATIARGAQKVIMEQQALGRRVDRVDVGHFHSPHACEWFIANGCLPGYSEFAKLNRMRPSPPSQYLVFHHPRYGAVDHKLIVLEEPIRATANDNAPKASSPKREVNASAINAKKRARAAKSR